MSDGFVTSNIHDISMLSYLQARKNTLIRIFMIMAVIGGFPSSVLWLPLHVCYSLYLNCNIYCVLWAVGPEALSYCG